MTLPELLVTLSLFSLLTTLILGGLDFVKRSTEHLRHYDAQQQHNQRLYNSLDSLLSHMVVTQTTAATDFSGDTEQWAGKSLYPLAQATRRLTAFRLQFRSEQGKTHLYYQHESATDQPELHSIFASQQSSTDWKLASWPSPVAPRFRYLGWDNTWQDTWQNKPPLLLPKAICLCSAALPPYVFQTRGRANLQPPPNAITQ